jgi:hypothetical protein
LGLDQGKLGNELHEDDQCSLSSHEQSVHEILDPKEKRCHEVIEDLIEAPHDSIEGYVYPPLSEEAHFDDEVHLHEDKGLVSYIPFQNFEFNESFDDLEREDFVEKPFEGEDVLGVLIPLCKEEHGSQEDEDLSTLFLIGRHRWDLDHCFFCGDPIYAMDSESMMGGNLN